ncbi:MAG: hypothetical protein KDD56_07640, partial [Bdellovibrionales bacterium]|nr:hypothetical protein [Bdellovibrionales bacterium]
LSWPREVEKLFGRNPKLAVQDVSRAVSKALKSASFNNNIRLLDTNWKIVYLGKDLAASQIPEYLRMACHPGWMTPPTNIYIAAEKIATNCNTGSLSPEKANISMLETLAHEMGHVVEAAILGNGLSQDRQRAEGFATWFEVYVAKYSSLISDESLKRRIFSYAKEYMKRNNSFDGSAGAYGYASLDFFAIVDRRGVAGLMDVYNKMQNSGVSFSTAYSEVTGWSDNKIQKERERVLN